MRTSVATDTKVQRVRMGKPSTILSHTVWNDYAGSLQIQQRLQWVKLYETSGDARLVCRRCGISRPTLRKWGDYPFTAFVYIVVHHIASRLDWVLAFLYMIVGLLIAQRIVINASGIKYLDFLKNVREKLFGIK